MINDDDEFACVFEGGPLDREILWLKPGTTHWNAALWPEPMLEPFSYTNAALPSPAATVDYVTYQIEHVGKHPTGCKYRGVLK